jgi:hypothetical protein
MVQLTFSSSDKRRLKGNLAFQEIVAMNAARKLQHNAVLLDQLQKVLESANVLFSENVVGSISGKILKPSDYYKVLQSQLILRKALRDMAFNLHKLGHIKTAAQLNGICLLIFGQDADYGNYSINFKEMLVLSQEKPSQKMQSDLSRYIKIIQEESMQSNQNPLFKTILFAYYVDYLLFHKELYTGPIDLKLVYGNLEKQLANTLQALGSLEGVSLPLKEGLFRHETLTKKAISVFKNIRDMSNTLQNQAKNLGSMVNNATLELCGKVSNTFGISLSSMNGMRMLGKVSHARVYITLGIFIVTLASSALGAGLDTTHVTNVLSNHSDALAITHEKARILDSSLSSSGGFLNHVSDGVLSNFMSGDNADDVARALFNHAQHLDLKELFSNTPMPIHETPINELFRAACEHNGVQAVADHFGYKECTIVDVHGTINGHEVSQIYTNVPGFSDSNHPGFVEPFNDPAKGNLVSHLGGIQTTADVDNVSAHMQSSVDVEPVFIKNPSGGILQGFGIVIQKTENAQTFFKDQQKLLNDIATRSNHTLQASDIANSSLLHVIIKKLYFPVKG